MICTVSVFLNINRSDTNSGEVRYKIPGWAVNSTKNLYLEEKKACDLLNKKGWEFCQALPGYTTNKGVVAPHAFYLFKRKTT